MSICPIPATSRRPHLSRAGYNSYQIFLRAPDGRACAVTPEMNYSTAMAILTEARHADALIAMGWEHIDAHKEAYMNAHGSLRDRISRSMSQTHTPIAVFQEGGAFASTLEHLIQTDDGICADQNWIKSALSFGETFTGGGGAAPTFRIVPLDHRDAPSHAAEALSLSEMDDLLRVFCAARGLPHKSADDLLAEMLGEELASTEVINWLSDYVDAYMNHREHP